MNNRQPSTSNTLDTVQKCPTGIKGLDDIVDGGLPRGRTTLVCGGPGCGKTLLATEFLVRGIQLFDEPGVFMVFEETPHELVQNSASLGIDINTLIEQNKLFIDYVFIERSEIEETGEYNLEGLFIRLGSAIDMVGAKRVVLDTLEIIFAGFSDEAILRSEVRRLFRWLKEKGVTAIVTGERGDDTLTRYGLEEYVSDCVILLENRIVNKIANRILRVIKYRGSSHGTDEYPFLISNEGIWVQPVSTMGLLYDVSNERISTGIPKLDEMLSGKGYFRGSCILVSGTAGAGKTSLAASLVDSACRNGENCLYFAFEESTQQIIRNMRSIGIDLQQWVDKGLLLFRAVRPSQFGIEMHLLTMEKAVQESNTSVVVVDPLTNLVTLGSLLEVKSMLVRFIDFLKQKMVTSLFTSLTLGDQAEDTTSIGISSLMDTWILLRSLETNGERNRGLYMLKSRGMSHSSQVREFRLSNNGIDLVDVTIGPDGVLIGSARSEYEARQRIEQLIQQSENEKKRLDLDRKRKSLENQIQLLLAEIASAEAEYEMNLTQQNALNLLQESEVGQLANLRLSKKDSQSNGPAKDLDIGELQ
jgi:circadian clock protein KaiC